MVRGCVSITLLGLFAAASGAQERRDTADGWWAYQPLARPEVPRVRQIDWVRSPIDAFVLAGLEARGLAPAAPADRYTLLRRLTYDLTGLPPGRAEIEAFVSDRSADAYEKVVDRLLASPQYGVKWAQHWLDVVRYAETDGYERDSKKPFVWRYRDWVVDALNDDMPYGEFLSRQLAGDELPGATVADQIATGYYRLGIWDDEPTDRDQHLYDYYDGIADTTARGMLAISMGCARCHDHKKDPLSQAEYHAFLGFFENIKPYEKKAETVPADGAEQQFAEAMAAWRSERAAVEEDLQRRVASLPQQSAGGEASGGSEPALVAVYGGDTLTATELRDRTGTGQHGRVVGQVVQVPGRKHAAMRFDGDDHVVLPRLVEDSFSVTFWVRSQVAGRGSARDPRWFTGTGLVDGEVPGIVDDWGIAWLGHGYIAAGTGRPETFVHSDGGLADGEWHHIGFTRDRVSGRIALYVDGRCVDEAIGSKRPLTSPADIHVGRMRPGGPGFCGDLDELRFYSRALTHAEVCALRWDLPTSCGPAVFDSDLLQRLNRMRAPELATVQVLAVRERGPQAPTPVVRVRGNVHVRGSEVDLGVPSMLHGEAVAPPVPTGASSGRRTALAQWITSPANPLTWRVIANRLWQHHFGRGIVRSANDFGRLGDLPTHVELLDWLACELLARGQSLKAMHRLIVTSQTYRMSSAANAAALAADPRNDTFWRFPRRRLTAEEVRDSILAVNGQLNLALGGPSVYPPLPAAVLATASRPDAAWGRSEPQDQVRRSLYVHVKRSLPEPLLTAFDRADTDSSCPVRFATVQPTQALTMLNGDFANRQAEVFASRLLREADDLRGRLQRGLELVTQRPARTKDVDRLLTLADDLQRRFGRSEAQALQRCCLVLLNCNEFLFLD